MKKQKSITILLMCMLLLVSVCAGILFGSVNIAFKDILNCLTGADRSSTSLYFNHYRAHSALARRTFAGIGLSCSGVILQGVMNNSLASPSTIGVNSGSGFAVMLAMIFFPANSFTLPVFAFCGALITHTALLIFFWLRSQTVQGLRSFLPELQSQVFKCRHQYDQTFKYGYHGESDVFSDRFPLRAYPKQADPAVPLYCYCILCFLVSRTAVKYARAWG